MTELEALFPQYKRQTVFKYPELSDAYPAIWNSSQNISSHYYQLFPTDKDRANTKFPP